MNQFNKLVSGNIPVLVDFYATWCGPCKMMHPVLEELKREVGDRARIVKIDVDKFSSIASTLQIQSVPTLMIYKKVFSTGNSLELCRVRFSKKN